jgi:hypothetical protein
MRITMRGTKVSLFPPWKDGGYVVLDLPEAIFSNLGLTYLAHTHIPTIWDNQSVIIDNVDWIREPNGVLHSEWRVPNGIVFGAQVTPRTEGVDLARKSHNLIEQRSGDSVRRLENTEPNENAPHRCF